jgi:hypothetical protein
VIIVAYVGLWMAGGVSLAWAGASGSSSTDPSERRNLYAMRIAGLFGFIVSAFAIGLLSVLS